ncbi:hypothetical protein [Novosphingobium resinovorum]|uniref:hypothetical protein n=1 Tax=Novosphingobium resinovorum TaxID=158500 RepID=UPI002ED2C773|nr:hypothetical protein [Novosphingobium resinovorum]
MRMPPRKYVLGAAALALLGAGAAEAASSRLHTMAVDAPDGSVVHVRYSGDIAPQVKIVPAEAADAADAMADPFARMERISAMMDAQMHAMMQRAAMLQQQTAQMQQQAVASGANGSSAPGFTVAGDMPQGMHVTYYSSSTDASGCTRSTSYSSDGSGAAPKVTQAASDGCDAVQPHASGIQAAIPAKAEAPVEQAPPPGRKV